MIHKRAFSEKSPRLSSAQRLRFLNPRCDSMSRPERGDAAAKNFRDDLAAFTGAVHAKIGELVGGDALGVQGAEAGFVAEERAAGHRHAAGEQNFDAGDQAR